MIAIIDYNKIQSFGTVKEVLDLGSLRDKFKAFGWNVIETNGHDHKKLFSAFKAAKAEKKKPSVIIADTIKGKGVGFMENELLWHYKSPSEEQYKEAIQHIERS